MPKDSDRSASSAAGRPALLAPRLSDYTRLPVELLIACLSLAPLVILAYCYSVLPGRIPVFLDLHGAVQVWAAKSIASVFRVPAMAIDLQVLCLLMKYGVVRSNSSLRARDVEEYRRYEKRAIALSVALWDWLRCLIAFKMCAESLDILITSQERLHFLRTTAWAIPWIAAILSIAGALFYGYRLWVVKRQMKKAVGQIEVQKVDGAHLYGGVLYYNNADPALFVNRYVFNFANKWLYVLFACLVAYPLLVFSV